MSNQPVILELPKVEDVKADIQRVFALQQKNQFKIAASTAEQRKAKLKKLKNAIFENRTKLHEALYNDFKKPSVEADLFDIYPATSESKHAIAHLNSWMRPHKVSTPLALLGTSSHIKYEPKGVVLIISPWNVPVNLTFGPLVQAIAAGNAVILKPSELTPHTSAEMTRIIREIFDESEVAIFEGGVDVSTELLSLPFNHIFFTGSPKVGKIVMRAAAEHLTSVTLELGGKCPTLVDETANVTDAASKITWAKFSNSGQTCLAPDYILVHESKKDRFLNLMVQTTKKLYGETAEDRKNSESYTRMVNHRNYLRVKGMLEDAVQKGAKVFFGGQFDDESDYIEPTILTQVTEDMLVMQEEIFGPLLPVRSFGTLDEALTKINSLPKSLAAYIYSKKNKNVKHFINNTRSGGTCVNDCTIHYGNPNLPFGGSNNSGIGKAHGFHGFKAFSNERAVLKQKSPYSAVQAMMPPYTDQVKKLVDATLKWF